MPDGVRRPPFPLSSPLNPSFVHWSGGRTGAVTGGADVRADSLTRLGGLRRVVTEFSVEIEVPADCDMDQAGETVAIEVHEDEYVLAAARAQGVWLPAFCQQGWCTTCAAELLDGRVDQSDSKRYYDVDEAAGFVLPCTGKPASDLRIRACQHEEMVAHRDSHDLPP